MIAYIEREMGHGKRIMWHTKLKEQFVYFFKPNQLANKKENDAFSTKRIRDKLDSMHNKIDKLDSMHNKIEKIGILIIILILFKKIRRKLKRP